MTNTNYDIVFVGGGPIALYFAKKLITSLPHYKIAIVDSERFPRYGKTHIIPRKYLDYNNYSKYIKSTFYKIKNRFDSSNEIIKQLEFDDQLCTLNEDLFYLEEVKSLELLGVKFVLKTHVLSFTSDENQISLFTTNDKISAKLVIDCSGVDSIFILRNENYIHKYYWNAYALKFKNARVDNETVTLFNYVGNIEENNIFVAEIPENDNTYTPWMYLISNERKSYEDLRALYKKVIKTEYLISKLSDAEIIREEKRIISAWEMTSRTGNRLISIGNAGGLTPFQNGMEFAFSFLYINNSLSNLINLIKIDQLDSTTLSGLIRFDKLTKINWDIGKLMSIIMMNSNEEEIRKGLKIFNSISPDLYLKLILFLNCDYKDLKEIYNHITKVIPINEIFSIASRKDNIDRKKIISEILKDLVTNLFSSHNY